MFHALLTPRSIPLSQPISTKFASLRLPQNLPHDSARRDDIHPVLYL